MACKKTYKKEINVIVVGAGISGLSAAQKLQTATLSHVRFNVTILEAGSEPGGRIQTVRFQGKAAELGARFLYFYKNFPGLSDFAISKGVAGKFSDSHDELLIESNDFTLPTVHLMSNGEEIPENVALHYKRMISVFIDELKAHTQKDDSHHGVYAADLQGLNNDKVTSKYSKPQTIEEFLWQRFSETVEYEASQGISVANKSIPRQSIFKRVISYHQFENGTKHFSDISIDQYTSYDIPEGQFELSMGYHGLIDAFVQELQSNTLQCNSVVKYIKWTPEQISTNTDTPVDQTDPPITVVCEEGHTYQAHHVIVTVSLGVLQECCCINTSEKKSSIPFFSPSLSRDKVDTIRRLGMGKGATLLVEFTEPLLDKPHQAIEFLWLHESSEKITEYKWIENLDVLLRVGDSTIYGAWFTGEDAIKIENASKDDICVGLCQVLEMFLKHPVAHPTRVEVSKWIQNPFVKGSYSYYAQGTSASDRRVLSEPISGRTPLQILFAGEATHETLYSTTNGAFETGIREANRLIELYST